MDSDAEYLKTGARGGDQEALAKIENITSVIPDKFITPVKEEYSYAVQPGEKPIVINRTDSSKPAFAYSDSVLSAKYVASDYDAAKSVQEKFDSATPQNDVGLLKVEGNFQDVLPAKNSDFKANDMLSTIGYTAYTDSSLTVDKIRNIPVASTSKVEQAYTKNQSQLVQTDTPVLPGNDGAPVFNAGGELVGFAVYGFAYCPDQQCFANGTVRSVSELQKLASDQNISFASPSNATLAWHSGVNQYFAANYGASAGSFATAGSDYGFNRWAEPLEKLAASLKGSEKDTSFMNQLQIVMIAALIVLAIATVILAILYWLHRRQIGRLQTGLYGAMETQQVVPPVQPTSPTALPPVQPAQQVATYPPSAQQAQELPSQPLQPTQYPPQVPPQPQQPQDQPQDPFYK